MVKRIAHFVPTKEQRDWVDKKKAESGESTATIMRNLIQEKVNKDKEG